MAPDTVQMLKQKIKNQMGNRPIGQTLQYNNVELENAKTMNDYGIKKCRQISSNQCQIEKTTIFMDFDKIEVDVWYDNGKKLSVEVKMTDTVKMLKEKIKAKVGIPLEGQKLLIQETASILGDEMTMEECGILTGKQICLKKKTENEEKNVKEENEKKF